MRVLHVTRDFPPETVGGVSTAVGGLLRASWAAGLDALVVSFDRWRPTRGVAGRLPALAPVDGILRLHHVSQTASAAALAEAFQPDIVHVHHAMLWPWAASVASQCGASLVKTVHAVQSVANRLRGVVDTASARAQRQALAEADAVIVASRAAQRAVLDDHPHLVGRLAMIPFGVDCDRYAGDGGERDPDTLIYVGRFDEMKGTDVFIEVARRIVERRPQTRVVVAGGVPAAPRSERRWKDRWRRDGGLGVEATEFLGWVSDERLPSLLCRASVAVLPSRFETFGLAVAEAMAAGVAVVGSAGTAHEDLIDDGRSGVLGEVGTTASYAEAALRLFDDAGHRRSIAAAGRVAVESSASWDLCYAAHREMYRGLAAGRFRIERSGLRPE